jgi:hypothetical protein
MVSEVPIADWISIYFYFDVVVVDDAHLTHIEGSGAVVGGEMVLRTFWSSCGRHDGEQVIEAKRSKGCAVYMYILCCCLRFWQMERGLRLFCKKLVIVFCRWRGFRGRLALRRARLMEIEAGRRFGSSLALCPRVRLRPSRDLIELGGD